MGSVPDLFILSKTAQKSLNASGLEDASSSGGLPGLHPPPGPFTLDALHAAQGVVEGVEGARFTASLRWEVLFHFLDNHYQLFRHSVSVSLFTER